MMIIWFQLIISAVLNKEANAQLTRSYQFILSYCGRICYLYAKLSQVVSAPVRQTALG